MSSLAIILIFLLQFEGVRGRDVYVYHRPGGDVILPCSCASSSGTTCSIISWLYSRDGLNTVSEVNNGNVIKTSARAARLSLSSDCSLIINNITADDVGRYTCRLGRILDRDTHVHLNILAISPSPDADPKTDGNVILECSLLRYKDASDCQPRSIRWVNETGAELDGEGDSYEVSGQNKCVSTLTVKRQSGNNRRYTCQYVEGNSVKIEAHYTPVFTDSTHRSALSYIMLLLRIIGLILFIVITVLMIRDKGSKKPLEDKNVHNDDANADDTPNYENEASAPH